MYSQTCVQRPSSGLKNSVVDRWALFNGRFMLQKFILRQKKCSVKASGRYSEVVVSSGLTITILRYRKQEDIKTCIKVRNSSKDVLKCV